MISIDRSISTSKLLAGALLLAALPTTALATQTSLMAGNGAGYIAAGESVVFHGDQATPLTVTAWFDEATSVQASCVLDQGVLDCPGLGAATLDPIAPNTHALDPANIGLIGLDYEVDIVAVTQDWAGQCLLELNDFGDCVDTCGALGYAHGSPSIGPMCTLRCTCYNVNGGIGARDIEGTDT